MKAKISRGDGFRGVLAYIHEKGDAETVGGNMSGVSVTALAREFAAVRRLRPDCKNPVWHCSLALPAGDRLPAEKWGELARDFMLEMGMDPDTHLYEAVRHSDTDHDHVHIIASRIGLDGRLWHGQKDVFRAIEATQMLEKKHGLTLTPGLDHEHKKERKALKHGELNMAIRTEVKPPRMVCQEAIDAVLQDAGDSMPAPVFIERLAALGVRAVPSVASTGTMNGFSFETEGVAFTGSKLGDSYKWTALQQRGIEYVKDRDFEKLADAKRIAAERSRAGESGPVAGASSGRSDHGADPFADAAGGRAEGAAGLRRGNNSAAPEPREYGHGDQRPGGGGDGAEGRRAGPDTTRVAGAGEGAAGSHERGGDQRQGLASPAGQDHSSGGGSGGRDAQQRGRSDQASRPSPAPALAAGAGAGAGGAGGRAGGGDWASRFKQASAARRSAGAGGGAGRALEPRDTARARVAEADRGAAREIDPTGYLEACGYTVRRDGRHLSVRDCHGDESYRVTRKDDGHWVTCDRFENGIGDNIALVQELEPGTGFAEAVYRLSGAPSVSSSKSSRPAPVRVPPQMPAQSAEDVKRGRAYLFERGITLETIQHAEQAGMLRYSARGVLFVGRDEAGTAQNIMRRAIDASELVQKRDLRGTDKRHPQMLLGATDTVLIVEGGIDALAAVDIARREKRPAPTVLVSGGANVKGFMQTPWVQKVLKLAKKVIVAFEREATPEAQAKTDQAHQVQMQRLQEVCGAEVKSWKPPEGIKDLAELNLLLVQQEQEREQEQERGGGYEYER